VSLHNYSVLKIFDTVNGNCGLTNDFFGEAAVFDFIQIELIFEAFFDYILIGNKQSDLVWFGRSQLQEMQRGIFSKVSYYWQGSKI
jgi:hypothetical protein